MEILVIISIIAVIVIAFTGGYLLGAKHTANDMNSLIKEYEELVEKMKDSLEKNRKEVKSLTEKYEKLLKSFTELGRTLKKEG